MFLSIIMTFAMIELIVPSWSFHCSSFESNNKAEYECYSSSRSNLHDSLSCLAYKKVENEERDNCYFNFPNFTVNRSTRYLAIKKVIVSIMQTRSRWIERKGKLELIQPKSSGISARVTSNENYIPVYVCICKKFMSLPQHHLIIHAYHLEVKFANWEQFLYDFVKDTRKSFSCYEQEHWFFVRQSNHQHLLFERHLDKAWLCWLSLLVAIGSLKSKDSRHDFTITLHHEIWIQLFFLLSLFCLTVTYSANLANVVYPPLSKNATFADATISMSCTVNAENILYLIDGVDANDNSVKIKGFSLGSLKNEGQNKILSLHVIVSLMINSVQVVCRAFNALNNPSTDDSEPALILIQGALDTPRSINILIINNTVPFISWAPPPILLGTVINGYYVLSTSGDSLYTEQNNITLNTVNPNPCGFDVSVFAYNGLNGTATVLKNIILSSIPSTERSRISVFISNTTYLENKILIQLKVNVSFLCLGEYPTEVSVSTRSSIETSLSMEFILRDTLDENIKIIDGTIELNRYLNYTIVVGFRNSVGLFNFTSLLLRIADTKESYSNATSTSATLTSIPSASKTPAPTESTVPSESIDAIPIAIGISLLVLSILTSLCAMTLIVRYCLKRKTGGFVPSTVNPIEYHLKPKSTKESENLTPRIRISPEQKKQHKEDTDGSDATVHVHPINKHYQESIDNCDSEVSSDKHLLDDYSENSLSFSNGENLNEQHQKLFPEKGQHAGSSSVSSANFGSFSDTVSDENSSESVSSVSTESTTISILSESDSIPVLFSIDVKIPDLPNDSNGAFNPVSSSFIHESEVTEICKGNTNSDVPSDKPLLDDYSGNSSESTGPFPEEIPLSYFESIDNSNLLILTSSLDIDQIDSHSSSSCTENADDNLFTEPDVSKPERKKKFTSFPGNIKELEEAAYYATTVEQPFSDNRADFVSGLHKNTSITDSSKTIVQESGKPCNKEQKITEKQYKTAPSRLMKVSDSFLLNPIEES